MASETCWRCNGIGDDPDTLERCPECGGDGSIPIVDRKEVARAAILADPGVKAFVRRNRSLPDAEVTSDA